METEHWFSTISQECAALPIKLTACGAKRNYWVWTCMLDMFDYGRYTTRVVWGMWTMLQKIKSTYPRRGPLRNKVTEPPSHQRVHTSETDNKIGWEWASHHESKTNRRTNSAKRTGLIKGPCDVIIGCGRGVYSHERLDGENTKPNACKIVVYGWVCRRWPEQMGKITPKVIGSVVARGRWPSGWPAHFVATPCTTVQGMH